MATIVNPADFLSLCVTGSAPIQSGCKILLVGQMTDGTATPNEVTQVIVGTEGDVFGDNSIIADMIRKADCACSAGIYAIGLEGVGTDAVFDVPVTVDTANGLVETAGVISIEALGCTFAVVAAVGDDAPAIQTALVDAINAKGSFPYTASVGGAGILLTADNLGEIGNQLAIVVTNEVPDSTVGPATVTDGAGFPDSTAAIEGLGECCYDCIAYGGTDDTGIDVWSDYAESTFQCDAPIQCFSQLYTAHIADTAAEHVLAADAIDSEAVYYLPVKTAHLTEPGYTTWQFAATHAALNCCACCDEPSRPVVRDNGILGCLSGDSDCATGGLWTRAEKAALAAAGAVVWDANGAGDLAVELNYTTYKTNDKGQPDVFWQTASARCVVKDLAERLVLNYERYTSVALFDDGTIIPAGTSGVTPNIINNETIAFLENEFGVTIDATDAAELVTTERDANDPNRVNQCINRASIVNALLRISVKLQLTA